MYWRVQKISVDQVAKAYGVYVVCMLSVFLNLLFISKIPSANKLTSQQRTDFDSFAREVTRHLTDCGFMTYTTSMTKLIKSELGPALIQRMTPDVLPQSMDAMKAIDRQLRESKSVCQVAIDEVKVGDPDSAHGGQIPIEVAGKVIKSSAGEVTGPDPFRFKFIVGMHIADPHDPTNLSPIVSDMQEMNPQAPPPGQ